MAFRRIDHDYVVLLREEGLTVKQIAEKVGCHRNSVTLILREHHKQIDPPKPLSEILQDLRLVKERLIANVRKAQVDKLLSRQPIKEEFYQYQLLRKLRRERLKNPPELPESSK